MCQQSWNLFSVQTMNKPHLTVGAFKRVSRSSVFVKISVASEITLQILPIET